MDIETLKFVFIILGGVGVITTIVNIVTGNSRKSGAMMANTEYCVKGIDRLESKLEIANQASSELFKITEAHTQQIKTLFNDVEILKRENSNARKC